MKQSKKKCVVLLLVLALCGSILLAGCDANAAVPQDSSSMGQMQGGPEGGIPPDMENGGAAPSEKLPEQGGTDEETALAENQSRIVGQVTSVVGNEVVLALGSYGDTGDGEASMPAPADSEKPDTAPGAASDTVGGSSDPSESDAPKDTKPSGPSGGKPEDDTSAASGDSSGSGGSSGFVGQERGQKRGSFAENGVSQTLQIPVGLSLTGAGGSGRSQDYSGITTGMILQITLEEQDDGSEAVTAVRVLSK